MSKERLEEIKRQFNINKSKLIRLGRNTHVTDDYEWLIKQAELVQELGEANKKNYWIAAEFKFENLKLEQQNKRYREALEEILDSSTNEIAEFIARKTLEESE